MVDKGPALDENLVFDFVHKSHFNLEVIQGLLKEEPALISASWDWGGGDVETGIEAASHVGRRDIALFLISRGARPNLFTAAMLGHLEIVKNFLTLHPELKRCAGPHGLSLIHHAEKGGADASGVLEFLRSLEETD
ncbi:MAG TPA: ankyrin repeat domain-containing protein [candidate division Zixibacteria bacterium]|nr:ankyrin repeat domain-containing protein [candidate division Zixibacteria bacterium]